MIMLLTHRSEIRKELNVFLRDKGHDICIPGHHQEAMAMMKDCQPDLIVLDLYLSEPNGLEVLRSLRREGYHGKVIVISGEAMRSVTRDAHSLGVDKVVHLPAKIVEHFDFGELETALQSSLRDKQQEQTRRQRRA